MSFAAGDLRSGAGARWCVQQASGRVGRHESANEEERDDYREIANQFR